MQLMTKHCSGIGVSRMTFKCVSTKNVSMVYALFYSRSSVQRSKVLSASHVGKTICKGTIWRNDLNMVFKSISTPCAYGIYIQSNYPGVYKNYRMKSYYFILLIIKIMKGCVMVVLTPMHCLNCHSLYLSHVPFNCVN